VGDFPGDEALKVLAADDEIVVELFVLRIVDGVFRVRLRIEEGWCGFGLLGERVDSGVGRSMQGWNGGWKIPQGVNKPTPTAKTLGVMKLIPGAFEISTSTFITGLEQVWIN
jgi:hypothetical protein